MPCRNPNGEDPANGEQISRYECEGEREADGDQERHEGLRMSQTTGVFPALSDNIRRKPKKGKRR